ncbi:unnamed protein product [Nesidiocoris tenuis]|uniref:Uncharacterized protein n=1 Tax=Nesidiocoris tenuis TaxID=355587 RepID=A0A6H5G7R6_9HEMI|nr:unnamed protein product [Nesidiocoris tenuis]
MEIKILQSLSAYRKLPRKRRGPNFSTTKMLCSKRKQKSTIFPRKKYRPKKNWRRSRSWRRRLTIVTSICLWRRLKDVEEKEKPEEKENSHGLEGLEGRASLRHVTPSVGLPTLPTVSSSCSSSTLRQSSGLVAVQDHEC